MRIRSNVYFRLSRLMVDENDVKTNLRQRKGVQTTTMVEPALSVKLNEYGHLVVTANEEMRREMSNRLTEAHSRYSDVSLWDVERHYIVYVIKAMIDDLGIDVIRVLPENIGALTDEAAMLLVDTGLPVGSEQPDDFYFWNEGWRVNEINPKYVRRVWWDRTYQIRSWVKSIHSVGECVFHCDLDNTEDVATEEASENAAPL